MNNSTESRVHETMHYLARANSDKASDYLTETEVSFWLDNYSDTLFCSGTLRRIIFTPITSNRYKVTTEKA